MNDNIDMYEVTIRELVRTLRIGRIKIVTYVRNKELMRLID